MAALLVPILAAALPARAEPPVMAPDDSQQVSVGVGLDPSILVVEAGYARRLGPVSLLASLALPTAVLDLSEHRLKAGVRTTVAIAGHWAVPAALQLGTQRGDNPVMRAVGLSLEPGLSPGWWHPAGFVAVDARYQATLMAHIRHTDFYREMYHPGAEDGWYRTPGHTVRTGVRAGLRNPRGVVELRGGVYRSGTYDRFLPPVFASLTAGWRW